MSKDERHERFVLPTRFKGKDADFLDVEFEFIKGDVYKRQGLPLPSICRILPTKPL